MKFREATNKDFEICCEQGISGGKFDSFGEIESHAWTLEHNGEILVVGGFLMITQTSAWGWFEMTQECLNHITETFRVIKDWLNIYCNERGISRIQAFVDTGNHRAIRTVEHLGFYRECTLKYFLGQYKDAYQYAKLFDKEIN